MKLLIAYIGDIELNPGPNSRNRIGYQGDANVRAPKFNICYRTVQTNSKRLMYEHCKLPVHLNCANVNLKIENSKIARLWSCHVCTLRELPLYRQDVLPINKKRWELTTTSTHTCHKTSRTQNTHQCISSKYKINDIKFWRVPIHGQRIEIRHHRPTQNMVKERQTSFRICQFT